MEKLLITLVDNVENSVYNLVTMVTAFLALQRLILQCSLTWKTIVRKQA